MQTDRDRESHPPLSRRARPFAASVGNLDGALPSWRGRTRQRARLVRRALAIADLTGLALAFGLAWVLFGSGAEPGAGALAFLLSAPAWLAGAKLYGLYDRDEAHPGHSTVDDLIGIFHLLTVGVWLLYAGLALTDRLAPELSQLVAFWAFALIAVTLARTAARAFSHRRLAYLQNTVVVGAGTVGQLIAHKLILHPEYGINLVGFVDEEPAELRDDLDHVALLGRPDELLELVRLFDVERVVFAFWDDSDESALDLIRSLQDLDVQIDIAPRLFELIGPNAGIHTVEGFPLVGLPSLHLSRASRFCKRAMDSLVSALGLVLCAPLLAAIAVAIKVSSPGPVFFRQVRMGAGDRVFSVFKFRTMVLGADEQKGELAHLNKHAAEGPGLFKIDQDPRVTGVGRFLRRYFLDELPQLINVLRGEMSLVGPRPLILDEDRHVGDWARRRLELKPGMTGLWQVLGHSAIPFEEMVKLDYLYVTTWSLRNDLGLILRTVPVVLRGGGGSY